MHLAITDLFNARWTDKIHDEWIRNVLKDRPDLKAEQLQRTRELMDRAVRDPKVHNYEDLIPALKNLPDANDAHVIAAAIKSKSDAIITYNVKDFPAEVLEKYSIEVIHPDDFIQYQIDLNFAVVCRAIKILRSSLDNPPISVDEYLETLRKLSLPQTAQALEEFEDII